MNELTTYFILSKNKNKNINNNDNQITTLDTQNNIYYILPRNNLNYHINSGLFESNLIEWSKQFCHPDKIFLDIGAHTGTYALSLSKYSKHVFAFEPQRMTYYSLCGSIALSNIKNITCFNFGIGSLEQSGFQTLNIISPDGGGSTIHNTIITHIPIITTEIIEIKSLDTINLSILSDCDNQNKYKIGFIKMDIEDNELHALQGARNTILQNDKPPILFESNIESPIRQQLFSYITELGYRIIPISGISNMYLAN